MFTSTSTALALALVAPSSGAGRQIIFWPTALRKAEKVWPMFRACTGGE